ncbi:MAG TPA: acetylglutamate kinase [Kofleriaceae bacterium]|jgi:acetylglutamate kinase
MSETFVIKIGGEVIGSGEAALLARDVAAFASGGARVALVHGGGPQATALSQQLGIPVAQVAGRRVTDAATLDVMKMVVAGKLNVDLCSALVAAGVRAVGLHGASATVVRATRRPPKAYVEGGEVVDMGLVGDVTGFNIALLATLWAADYVPVLACLGSDGEGHVYNINADMVGNQLASALGADRLFLVTSTPGVLRDVKDPSSRIPQLTKAQALAAIADGTVGGGMVPKIEEALAVLESGVGTIHILGKLGPGDLLRCAREPGAVGTTLVS